LIYTILGLHKSGTTLTARLLHQAGIDMGPDTGGESYDAGDLFERPETKILNKRLLGVDHNKWLRTYPRASFDADPDTCEEARHLITTMAARGSDWGFKDPRTVLTYPFWESVLPDHRVVGIYRDPAALWQRTRRIFGRKWHQNPMRATQLVSRWLEHNARLRDIVRRRPQTSLLLAYEQLMENPAELDRLKRFIDRPLPDVRDPSLRRGQSEWTPLLRGGRLIAERRTGMRVDALRADLDALRQAQIAHIEEGAAAPPRTGS
jgi:hypothetical protein